MIFVQCVQASTHQIVVPDRHSRTACLERCKLHKHPLGRHSKASSDFLGLFTTHIATYWYIIIKVRLSLQSFGSWSFWGTMGAIISFGGGVLDCINKSYVLHSLWRLVPQFLVSQSLATSKLTGKVGTCRKSRISLQLARIQRHANFKPSKFEVGWI